MWLMTTYGFFSVACAREGHGEHGQSVDLGRVMIRGRSHQQLKALKERFAGQLGDCEIIATQGADYPWRIFCPKSVWAECVRVLVLDMAYDNFKDICTARHGRSSAYVDALHKTWDLFRGME